MVKVQSGSLVLFHYLPGQHELVARWHNEIHRPEIQGAVPHVFYSQDFVAPPDHVAARYHADLPMAGGEYLTVYWSEGDADQYAADSRRASQDRRNAGSYHPFQDVVWAARLVSTGATGRPGLGYDVNAAPLVPHRGVVLLAERLADADARAEYTTWFQTIHAPRVLALGPFSACFDFVAAAASEALLIHVLYVDRDDPLASLRALRAAEAHWRSSEASPDRFDALRSEVFSGSYVPIRTGHYDTYT
jgi:hypothetical protein